MVELSCGYFSTETSRRERLLPSWLWACWYAWSWAGSVGAWLGSMVTLVALARALITSVSVDFSKLAEAWTVLTRLGIRSLRRW